MEKKDKSSKMSELASFELKDLSIIKILICYLLYQLNRTIAPEQLYEIAVGTDIINYFYYQEAIDALIKNNTILVTKDDKDNQLYILTEKGNQCAKEFHNFVPKTFRDKLVKAALQYFSKLKLNNEVIIKYIKLKKGYYVHCRCLDVGDDLLDLKLFAPDITQAHLLGEQIMVNPVGFYAKIINFALGNEEEEYNLDDI